MDREPTSLTIYSAWRGILLAVVSPAVLTALGGYSAARAGLTGMPVILITLGLGMGLVTLLDYPRASRFDPEGVERICFLRRHFIPWHRIDVIGRTAPRRLYRRGRPPEGSPLSAGGLSAKVGRRRYLLTSHVESRFEFDQLAARVREWSPATHLRAARPVEGVPPSHLYRRIRQEPH